MTDHTELRELMGKATPGPYLVRPNLHDDWGLIRAGIDAEGYSALLVNVRNVGVTDDEMNQHRAARTDPFADDAAYIAAACNAVPSLLDENDRLRERVAELEGQRNALARFVDSAAGEDLSIDGVEASDVLHEAFPKDHPFWSVGSSAIAARPNPKGFTPFLEQACAARCADCGDPPCWRLPELVEPCDQVTPCPECLEEVATTAP